MRGKLAKKLRTEGITSSEWMKSFGHLSEQKPKFKNHGIRKSKIKKTARKTRRQNRRLGENNSQSDIL